MTPSPTCRTTIYASQPVIDTAAIRGSTIDTSAGNVDALEWVELATELDEQFGGTPSPDHHPGMSAIAAAAVNDVARHIRETGWPLLTMLDLPAVPGTAILPLVDPTPVYPWVMTHRRDVRHSGLPALRDAVKQLTAENRWLDVPASAWFATGRPTAGCRPGVSLLQEAVGPTPTPASCCRHQ